VPKLLGPDDEFDEVEHGPYDKESESEQEEKEGDA
jgi:hypothetical protein